jgi:hypothetical protein
MSALYSWPKNVPAPTFAIVDGVVGMEGNLDEPVLRYPRALA